MKINSIRSTQCRDHVVSRLTDGKLVITGLLWSRQKVAIDRKESAQRLQKPGMLIGDTAAEPLVPHFPVLHFSSLRKPLFPLGPHEPKADNDVLTLRWRKWPEEDGR